MERTRILTERELTLAIENLIEEVNRKDDIAGPVEEESGKFLATTLLRSMT